MATNWNIPKVLKDGTAYILGGGASIISQFGIPASLVKQVRAGKLPMSVYSNYFECLQGKFVIGVNAVFQIGSWMDAIYFLDKDFMLTWRGELAQYPNPVYSALPYSEGEAWVNTVRGSKVSGICRTPNTVAYNFNAGAGAINLAYHMGAKTIVLIGFDMRSINKKQHFHGAYINSKLVRTAEHKMKFSRHLQVFPAIKEDAKELGITILNTSLKSVLTEFKKVPLKDTL